MKLSLSREWFEKRINDEGATDVTAGSLSPEPLEREAVAPQEGLESQISAQRELHLAFGTLLRQLRRKTQLTIEELSREARVEVAELLEIERDLAYAPEVRTVHQLASYFSLPPRALMKLSGVTVTHGSRFRAQAVRFAAKSEAVQSLSREERKALSEFIEFLIEGEEEKVES